MAHNHSLLEIQRLQMALDKSRAEVERLRGGIHDISELGHRGVDGWSLTQWVNAKCKDLLKGGE